MSLEAPFENDKLYDLLYVWPCYFNSVLWSGRKDFEKSKVNGEKMETMLRVLIKKEFEKGNLNEEELEAMLRVLLKDPKYERPKDVLFLVLLYLNLLSCSCYDEWEVHVPIKYLQDRPFANIFGEMIYTKKYPGREMFVRYRLAENGDIVLVHSMLGIDRAFELDPWVGVEDGKLVRRVFHKQPWRHRVLRFFLGKFGKKKESKKPGSSNRSEESWEKAVSCNAAVQQ